ncbi:MAG: sigma-70 family RNA polymerase sigma factor [Clostridia bacterium]|nr:sigma-70 family RNA polymerase sigma factor [Clostridia bacterium]
MENFENLTDDVLIAEINNGRYEFLQPLLARYTPVVRALAKQYAPFEADVEDYVQDGLIALYGAVRDYRAGQASFSTFVRLCVKRTMLDLNRASGRKRRIPPKMVSSLEDAPEVIGQKSAEAVVIERESYQTLTDHIKVDLSGFEYRVLSAFLSGSGYAEIAEAEGVSVKSVNNALSRVRKKLRESNHI